MTRDDFLHHVSKMQSPAADPTPVPCRAMHEIEEDFLGEDSIRVYCNKNHQHRLIAETLTMEEARVLLAKHEKGLPWTA